MIFKALYTAQTDLKGWGVFTDSAIDINTIIEISPVVILTSSEKELIDQTILYNYIFDWDQGNACMALGLVPVYNHAVPSNCEYFQDYENNTILIKTVRDIEANEELTINYNGDYDNEKEVWFEVAK